MLHEIQYIMHMLYRKISLIIKNTIVLTYNFLIGFQLNTNILGDDESKKSQDSSDGHTKPQKHRESELLTFPHR